MDMINEEQLNLDLVLDYDFYADDSINVTIDVFDPEIINSSSATIDESFVLEDVVNNKIYILDPSSQKLELFDTLFLNVNKVNKTKKDPNYLANALDRKNLTISFLNSKMNNCFEKYGTFAIIFILYKVSLYKYKSPTTIGAMIVEHEKGQLPEVIDFAVDSIFEDKVYGDSSVDEVLSKYPLTNIFYNLNEKSPLIAYFESDAIPLFAKHRALISNLFESFIIKSINPEHTLCSYMACDKHFCSGCFMVTTCHRLFGASTDYKENKDSLSSTLKFVMSKYNMDKGSYQISNLKNTPVINIEVNTDFKQKFKSIKKRTYRHDLNIKKIYDKSHVSNRNNARNNARNNRNNENNDRDNYTSLPAETPKMVEFVPKAESLFDFEQQFKGLKIESVISKATTLGDVLEIMNDDDLEDDWLNDTVDESILRSVRSLYV